MLIAIDHGNYAIKTPNFNFVSGLIESTVAPPFSDEILVYNGKHFSLTEKRIVYRRDKTKDEQYFILTLFAIGKELEAAGRADNLTRVDLAVGLPPQHYGILKDAFTQYFKRHHSVNFRYNNKNYSIVIGDVMVFPQAYAAIITKREQVLAAPRLFIVDIGGYTTDILLLKNGKPDLQFCKSLDNGIITMNNEIINQVNILYDAKIDDEHITELLTGKPSILDSEIKEYIVSEAKRHTADILGKLKEMEIDLQVTKTFFMGGGSMLLKQFITEIPALKNAEFIENPNANAIGYQLLGNAQLVGKRSETA